MSYFLGVDIGSVNAKMALIDENGEVVRFDTEKLISSPRAAVSSLIARPGDGIQSQRGCRCRRIRLWQGCYPRRAWLGEIQQLAGDCLRAASP